MTRRQDELALRRQALQMRSERLRRELAEAAGVIEESVSRVDRLAAAARRVSSPLAWLVVGAALVLIVRPARPLVWLTRGLVALSIVRRAAELIGSLSRQDAELRGQVSRPK